MHHYSQLAHSSLLPRRHILPNAAMPEQACSFKSLDILTPRVHNVPHPCRGRVFRLIARCDARNASTRQASPSVFLLQRHQRWRRRYCCHLVNTFKTSSSLTSRLLMFWRATEKCVGAEAGRWYAPHLETPHQHSGTGGRDKTWGSGGGQNASILARLIPESSSSIHYY